MTTTLPMTGARGRVAWALQRLGRVPLPLLQLLFRLALAGVFLKAGLNKIASWELSMELFADEYTAPLLGMIMTIQLFVYPSAYAEHLTWASILIFLLTHGAGPWSLDRLVGLESEKPGGNDGRART
jgi:putative oxidoreductase